MLYLSILLSPWAGPNWFSPKNGFCKKIKKRNFWSPRNRRNTYIWSIWALVEIRRSNPKRTPKLARKRPSFDDRFELWTALKCFVYNGLGAFELCEAPLFRAKIVPTETQKTHFWRPQKALKCLYIYSVWTIVGIPEGDFPFHYFGSLFGPPRRVRNRPKHCVHSVLGVLGITESEPESERKNFFGFKRTTRLPAQFL